MGLLKRSTHCHKAIAINSAEWHKILSEHLLHLFISSFLYWHHYWLWEHMLINVGGRGRLLASVPSTTKDREERENPSDKEDTGSAENPVFQMRRKLCCLTPQLWGQNSFFLSVCWCQIPQRSSLDSQSRCKVSERVLLFLFFSKTSLYLS